MDWGRPLVLVEGLFDGVKAGYNSIPLFGSLLREDYYLFEKIVEADQPVFLALDPDAKKKTNEITKLLLQYDVECYVVNVDPFEDVGVMSKEEFKVRRENAAFMTETEVFRNRLRAIC